MDRTNDRINPAAHQTPATSMSGMSAPEEILPSGTTPSNIRASEQRHLLSPNCPPTSNVEAEEPLVGTTGDEKLGGVPTTADEFKQQGPHEGKGEINWQTQTAAEYLDEITQLRKLDLRPCAFTSLADAFHASLCVVRFLRAMVRLHGGPADVGHTGQHPGSSRPLQELNAGGRSAVAEVLSHQESFVADEAAYHHLLSRPSCAPQEPAHAPAQPAPDGASTTQKGLLNPFLQGGSARSPPGEQTVVSSGCSALVQGEALKPESQAVSGMFTSTKAQTQGRLEYELSVCKALLLLQHLTPNSSATIEESPSLPSSQSVAPQNIAGRIPSYSAYSTTNKICEFTKISDSCRGFQSAILEILLRVRLLQGTQQLVRADFARLLHQQQKQQQQLLKAVQTTVMKLEAERDSLLGRMQKLSTFVSRK